MAAQLRIAVHVPAYGAHIAAEQAKMWTEIGKTLADSRERFKLVSFGYVDVNPIDRARNICVATAMLNQADWLVMIDADTWIDGSPDEDAGVMLLRMISDADRLDATLVSAPVIKRTTGLDGARNLAVYTVEALATDPVEFLHKSEKFATLPRRLVEADAVGAACCALNMHKAQAGNLHYQSTPRLSEDLDMCRQIRALANKPNGIYVDARVHTGHSSRSFPLLTREL